MKRSEKREIEKLLAEIDVISGAIGKQLDVSEACKVLKKIGMLTMKLAVIYEGILAIPETQKEEKHRSIVEAAYQALTALPLFTQQVTACLKGGETE